MAAMCAYRAMGLALAIIAVAACGESLPATPRVVEAGAPARATVGTRCDASYPGICIPPPPPDLDCKDIRERRFTVRQPDPHGFDADRDGVGCE